MNNQSPESRPDSYYLSAIPPATTNSTPSAKNTNNWTNSLPVSAKFTEPLNNPSTLKNPETLGNFGVSAHNAGSAAKFCLEKAEEHDGPKGAAFGAVGGGALAVGAAMLFSAPVSVPFAAICVAGGAIGGWIKRED